MQTSKKKIIAICGSTRLKSTNLNLIKSIELITHDIWDFTIYLGIAQLPHFNPDLDQEESSDTINEFRNLLRANDAILICSPEYAMGVPGTLKNALDWTVSSMEFSNKPTALITASSMGMKAHQSLIETLTIIESKMSMETQLLISHASTKINSNFEITDSKTSAEIENLIVSLNKLIEDGNN